jgi:hypothetical protein
MGYSLINYRDHIRVVLTGFHIKSVSTKLHIKGVLSGWLPPPITVAPGVQNAPPITVLSGVLIMFIPYATDTATLIGSSILLQAQIMKGPAIKTSFDV